MGLRIISKDNLKINDKIFLAQNFYDGDVLPFK
jgi:hypothetical protein